MKAILRAPSPSEKHAQWWTKVYGSGMKNLQIIYWTGKENSNTDALSRNPQLPAPAPAQGTAEPGTQVTTVNTSEM